MQPQCFWMVALETFGFYVTGARGKTYANLLIPPRIGTLREPYTYVR